VPQDQLPDCPAQHGGAKRQQLTDVAAWPKRGVHRATPDRTDEIQWRLKTHLPEYPSVNYRAGALTQKTIGVASFSDV